MRSMGETISVASPVAKGADTDREPPDRVAPGDSGSGGLGLGDWLNAELPSIPTLLRTRPRRKPAIRRELIVYGSVAIGATLLVLLLGVAFKSRPSTAVESPRTSGKSADLLKPTPLAVEPERLEEPRREPREAGLRHDDLDARGREAARVVEGDPREAVAGADVAEAGVGVVEAGDDGHSLSTIWILRPIQAITGTAMEFPSALYLGPSGHSFLPYGIFV